MAKELDRNNPRQKRKSFFHKDADNRIALIKDENQ
jgi:hypothetical protein